MSARVCLKHGKPFPCGPCRIESAKRPPQAPPLPLEQLTATANEVNVVSDAFGLVRQEKPRLIVKKKKLVPKSPTAKEQFNLSRREIAALFEIPGVNSALCPEEAKRYFDLAAGNTTEQTVALEIGMKDVVGVGVYIEDLEKRIIRKALLLGVRLRPQTKVETDTFDRTMDSDRAADEKSISDSGGELIGGSIISRGTTSKGNPRPLDSFDRGGKIVTQTGDFAATDISKDADFDDYGEDSAA